MITLIKVLGKPRYVSEPITMQREEGLTPNGDDIRNRWVLRIDGKFIDYDNSRYNLAERNNVKLSLGVNCV